MDSAPGNLGARVEQVANKAADKVQQAGEKVASGSGTGTAGTGGTTSGTGGTLSAGRRAARPGSARGGSRCGRRRHAVLATDLEDRVAGRAHDTDS